MRYVASVASLRGLLRVDFKLGVRPFNYHLVNPDRFAGLTSTSIYLLFITFLSISRSTWLTRLTTSPLCLPKHRRHQPWPQRLQVPLWVARVALVPRASRGRGRALGSILPDSDGDTTKRKNQGVHARLEIEHCETV